METLIISNLFNSHENSNPSYIHFHQLWCSVDFLLHGGLADPLVKQDSQKRLEINFQALLFVQNQPITLTEPIV
jgi:hypothetical protein